MAWLKGSRLFPFAVLMAFDSAITDVRGQSDIIVTGDSWAYWDAGANQIRSGRVGLTAGDSTWDAGPSPLGYNEPYIATRLQSPIMTAYFRHRFSIPTIPLNRRSCGCGVMTAWSVATQWRGGLSRQHAAGSTR